MKMPEAPKGHVFKVGEFCVDTHGGAITENLFGIAIIRVDNKTNWRGKPKRVETFVAFKGISNPNETGCVLAAAQHLLRDYNASFAMEQSKARISGHYPPRKEI